MDRACKIKPIDNVESVTERYRSYIAECVSPPVKFVEVDALKEESGEGGVVLLNIPKGNARPHMSVAVGHHRFYRRVADRFQQMERYEIEEMFRLKDSPKLSLQLQYLEGGKIGGNDKSYINFGLRNDSNVSAKFPYISVAHNPHSPKVSDFGLDGNGGTLFKRLTTGPGGEILFSGGAISSFIQAKLCSFLV